MPALEKADRVGSTINNWLKIGGIAVGAIVSCTYAYYLILSNVADISDLKKENENLKADSKRQYGIFNEKDEKKETQYKEAASKFMDWMLKHEDRLNQLEKESSYQKGWRESEQFYNQKSK